MVGPCTEQMNGKPSGFCTSAAFTVARAKSVPEPKPSVPQPVRPLGLSINGSPTVVSNSRNCATSAWVMFSNITPCRFPGAESTIHSMTSPSLTWIGAAFGPVTDWPSTCHSKVVEPPDWTECPTT